MQKLGLGQAYNLLAHPLLILCLTDGLRWLGWGSNVIKVVFKRGVSAKLTEGGSADGSPAAGATWPTEDEGAAGGGWQYHCWGRVGLDQRGGQIYQCHRGGGSGQQPICRRRSLTTEEGEASRPAL